MELASPISPPSELFGSGSRACELSGSGSSKVCNQTPLEHIVWHAGSLLGEATPLLGDSNNPQPAALDPAAIVRALNDRDVKHAWQLKFVSNDDWNAIGVSLGMRCCINKVLSSGDIFSTVISDAESEADGNAGDAYEWFPCLMEQVPWAGRFLTIAALRPRARAGCCYCLFYYLTNFTNYVMVPGSWITILYDKAFRDTGERWMLGGLAGWHTRMMIVVTYFVSVGALARARVLHVSQQP